MLVAQRILKLRVGDHEVDVPVHIYRPVDKHDHWECRYEIDWPSAVKRHAARGVDSMQALLLAMQMIGAEIYASDAHRDKKVRLERLGAGYGFPLPKAIRDMSEGDDKNM